MDIQKNHFFTDVVNKLNIEILDSGYVNGDSHWNGKNICSPYSRLYYIESGHAKLKYGNEEINMKPGFVYLVPTGFLFSYMCESSYTKLFFHFNLTSPDGYDIFENCKKCLVAPMAISEIKKLIADYNSGTVYDVMEIKKEIFNRAVSMLPSSAVSQITTSVYSPIVQSTIDYIQLNLSLKLTSAFLAERLFVSESTLCKRFRDEVGVTIGKYIDDLIFFNAEKMLLKSDWSIGRISKNLGFCDQFYFSRRFKQHYGKTPLQYRKKQSVEV
ncbi:MAG: helix-turn-helix transcriptional regulator [Clostridia bacterium]|nr:helix-turn-helix transcriptional regulator [Clostridia bacterium]